MERHEAQQRYDEYVRAGIGLPSIWSGLRGQVFLGNDAFVARLTTWATESESAAANGTAARGNLLEIPQAQRRAPAQPIAAYQALHPTRRNTAIQAAYASGGYTMPQLA